MAKLADGLYHQRRGADLLAGRLDPGGWVDAGGGAAVDVRRAERRVRHDVQLRAAHRPCRQDPRARRRDQ